jgi:energy-coupling factor transporter ATP-binding protein EcfA2
MLDKLRAPSTPGMADSNDRWLPPRPEVFIPPSASFVKEIDLLIAARRRILLLGKQGSGKTTFALELCRNYVEKTAGSESNQIPVFISLAQLNHPSGIFSYIVERISKSMSSRYRPNVDKMLAKGSLFLILDDLDSLDKFGHGELEKFIKRVGKNSFLCVLTEKPNYPFLEGHNNVLMPDWNEQQITNYFKSRITDETRRNELIRHLTELKLLERPLTPWQVRFIAEIFLKGEFHTLIYQGNLNSDVEFHILDAYLKIVFTNSGLQYIDGIKEIGKLSLKLLKQGYDRFDPEKEHINVSHLQSLKGKLFLQQGNFYAFISNLYQAFLAGRYLSEFWLEARNELMDKEAKTLVWTPVYNCAVHFITDEYKQDLHDIFQVLSRNFEPGSQ